MEKCDKCGEFIEFARLCPLCAHYEKERLKRSAKKCEERARKAEAIARELVAALEETSSIIARWPGPNGRWQAEELADIGRWNELATKAKEVLGDGKIHTGR